MRRRLGAAHGQVASGDDGAGSKASRRVRCISAPPEAELEVLVAEFQRDRASKADGADPMPPKPLLHGNRPAPVNRSGLVLAGKNSSPSSGFAQKKQGLSRLLPQCGIVTTKPLECAVVRISEPQEAVGQLSCRQGWIAAVVFTVHFDILGLFVNSAPTVATSLRWPRKISAWI